MARNINRGRYPIGWNERDEGDTPLEALQRKEEQADLFCDSDERFREFLKQLFTYLSPGRISRRTPPGKVMLNRLVALLAESAPEYLGGKTHNQAAALCGITPRAFHTHREEIKALLRNPVEPRVPKKQRERKAG
ncbi:MAG: hypothetical protein AAGJ81_08220 [Verrucomicrobiota bacterium]